MKNDFIVLTKEIFEKGKSVRGGYSNAQILMLGIESKEQMKKGWAKALIGKTYERDAINEFLRLKDKHLTERRIKAEANRKIGGNRLAFTVCPSDIPYPEQYLHPNWQKMRMFILNRDKYKCVNCQNDSKTLHAHHIRYIKGKFIWEVPHYYIVTLCEDCHSEEHGRDLRANK